MRAVELKNVTFSYDEKVNIVENIDFYADFGKVTLLAGHSGEGKSTLLSIMSGIIPNIVYGKLEGEVKIGDTSIIGKKSGEICRKVGVVLQNADEQIIQKYVRDEIAFGCENLAFPPQLIDKQINTVCGLLKLDKDAIARTLSGGQKQRLITASTLAMGQKVIILDEPLANLDKDGSVMLMNTFLSLAKAGYAIIVVEHRLDVVLPFVNDVWHIGNKKVTKITDFDHYLEEQSVKIKDKCPVYTETDPQFIVKNLGFSVKKKEILKDISCVIPKCSRTVLLGENGCGKTTFLRNIARLYYPTKGTIDQFINPEFTNPKKKKQKGSKKWYKKVGVVYQNPDYQLFMPTVKQELSFGAESEEYALEIAKMFDILHLLERHPQSLSEGQKRRVSIAAVVATNPEVILLDEPTVGQDYEGLENLVEILNTLHEKNHNTLITVTHDVRCAEALCDKAIYIKDGVVYKTGGKELVREYFKR